MCYSFTKCRKPQKNKPNQVDHPNKANVHAYIGDIEKAVKDGKFKTPNNLYLMHYNHIPSEEKSSEVKKWCGGFVEPGSIFELE